MDKSGRSNREMTDRQTVQHRHAKDAFTTKQDAMTEQTTTKSRSSQRRYIAMAEYARTAMEYAQTGIEYARTGMKYTGLGMKYALTYGSLATASFLPSSHGLIGNIEATTAPSTADGHSSAISPRNALYNPLELGDIASSSDSQRQYKNMGPDEVSRLRIGNVELPRPTANDVEHILQDEKFQRDILSACRNPEYVKKFLDFAKNNKFMDSIRPMFLDEHFITFLSDLCQDSKVRDNFVTLAKNNKFMNSIRPLINGKDVEYLQQSLEARQEETRSHNLDATLESFERPKGSMRRLLREERRWAQRNLHNERPTIYNDNPDSTEYTYLVKRPSEFKPDNNPERDLSTELLQQLTYGLYALTIGVVSAVAIGLYCFKQTQNELTKKGAGLAEMKEALANEKIKTANEIARREKLANEFNRLKMEMLLNENYELQKNLQPPVENVRKYRPDNVQEINLAELPWNYSNEHSGSSSRSRSSQRSKR